MSKKKYNKYSDDSFEIRFLSEKFFGKYIPSLFSEIENKKNRPYYVMILDINGNKFALPFRTNIRHDFCYKFSSSGRPTESITGIDFTKAVIVNDPEYIGEPARIDDTEYNILLIDRHIVNKDFRAYLNGYIRFVKNNRSVRNFPQYRYTSLKYFHKELGIEQ